MVGPNHKLNFCNSPIMLNKFNTNYKNNLSLYYIKHFSKFIKPGNKRIGFSNYSDKLEVTTFKNKNKSIIIVLLNRSNYTLDFNLKLENYIVHDNINKHSIITFEVILW